MKLKNKILSDNKIILYLLIVFMTGLFSCEKKNDTVIDPSYDAPLIYSITKSSDTVFTTSASPDISLTLSAIIGRNNGADINNVSCNIFDPAGNQAGSYNLINISDSTYRIQFTLSNISCLLVGNYSIILNAVNTSGIAGNQVNTSFYVMNTANVPPQIVSVTVPDSVVRPVSGSFDITLYATASDIDGLCDIQEVYFDAYRSTGNYIGRIQMNFENSQWSFTNPIIPAIPDSSYGYYKYHFFAKDNSNANSTGVWDSIKFVRP